MYPDQPIGFDMIRNYKPIDLDPLDQWVSLLKILDFWLSLGLNRLLMLNVTF